MQKVSVNEGRSGLFSIVKFSVSDEEAKRHRLMCAIGGYAHRAVPPGSYTKLQHDTRGVIMSDTPAEMSDHIDAVAKAKGSCLINGLGIGMVLHNVLLKQSVTDVTVIEVERDVIELVSEHYERDKRVTIIHASAYDFSPPKGKRYSMVWHDIWDTICSDNLPLMSKLHRKYGRIADWQGSWARVECERMRRRGE